VRRDWLEHLLLVRAGDPVDTLVCGMPLWLYVVAIVIPATACC